MRVPIQADNSGLDFIPPLDVTVPECAPLVVVCYGTAGSTSESYVQQLAAAVSRSLADGGLGGRVAIVNVCQAAQQMQSAKDSSEVAPPFH